MTVNNGRQIAEVSLIIFLDKEGSGKAVFLINIRMEIGIIAAIIYDWVVDRDDIRMVEANPALDIRVQLL